MKTSLAIKMKSAVFFLDFSAFISVDTLKMANKVELPYRVLGPAPKEIDFVQTLLHKELYGRVRTGCKEKRTGRAKFVLFYFIFFAIHNELQAE